MLDKNARKEYNEKKRSIFDKEYDRPKYADSKMLASTLGIGAYGTNNPASTTKMSGVIRAPGYNKQNSWSENPDIDDYGENSTKYKMLVALDSAYLNTTDEKQKEKYKKGGKNACNT